MFMIGIDPHRASHTASAVDHTETVIDTLRVIADGHQRQRLLSWAPRFEPRTWAIEGATGMGALLAQQLAAAGEHVVALEQSNEAIDVKVEFEWRPRIELSKFVRCPHVAVDTPRVGPTLDF